MSEKFVIVVGDKTSHGGVVLTGDPHFEICDKPAAFLGDKVHCPEHGETEIIEGFLTTMIEPNKTLAYDGYKTSCGAVLIAGGQDIVVIAEDAEPGQFVSVAINENSEKSEEEFNLFVATVWGEACGQSKVGWEAVGSVIINRMSHHYWSAGGRNKSVTDVIMRTGFDAAKGQEQFLNAHAFLLDPEKNKNSLNEFERKTIKKMIDVLRPIYYEKSVTTNANHYYSPKAQALLHKQKPEKYKEVPDFVNEPDVKPVQVEGLEEKDDLKFYKRS